ncbi:odorant receptor 131-2-like [Nelusetta ayraudi]|uniref:odorant receptor 131-2-like n=1 Tax=Nelusetta ayraudi TaxID=303726 RepID=UPI003F6F2174
MNTSLTNVTVVIQYQDSLAKAVSKNVIVLVLGLSVTCINASAIRTFCKHQIFYTNPRYILFIHLVINDMVQVTLTVVLFVTSYTVYRIHTSLCCALILLTLFTTQNTPLCLACMAVECYVAVRAPLRHAQICTVRRTLAAMGVLLAITTLSALSDLFIVIATQPPGFFLSRMFCMRENVLPSLLLVRKRDITYWVFLAVVWITVFYTYFRIMLIAKEVSQDAKKARKTLALHGVQVLLSMASYMIPQAKHTLQKWFPENLSDLRFVLYVVFQVIPRSLTPILYGFRDNAFRRRLKGLFFSESSGVKHK